MFNFPGDEASVKEYLPKEKQFLITRYIPMFFETMWYSMETRRDSPVDNRPSTNKLQHYVQQLKKKMGHYMWGEVSLLSNFQLPSSYGFGMKFC